MSMAEFIAVLPLVTLGMGSVAVLLAGAFIPSAGRRELNLLGAVIGIASAISAAPYASGIFEVGGMVGVGPLRRIMDVAAGLTAAFTLLISTGYGERRPTGHEEYPALVLFAAFGMDLLASATSLVGLFLGLESMSLALYVLLASNREDARSGEAGLKYLVVGAVSTAFLAFGLALVYVQSGTLNIAGAMLGISEQGGLSAVGLAGWSFMLVGFGFKLSLFPFHLWAPDVYEGGPAPVVAFLSTGSKAAVAVALIWMTLAPGGSFHTIEPALWTLAAATMIFGNVAALTSDNLKRLLAYSSMAQMGYVMVAVISAPAAGADAAVFFLLVYLVMDMGAFGVVASMSGRDRDMGDIASLRGLGFVYPFRSAVLTVCLVSLAGLPPTAGFIAKFMVFRAAVESGHVYLAVIGVLTAIVSVYYYLKVVIALYMREPDAVTAVTDAGVMARLDPEAKIALAVLAALLLLLGVLPGGLIGFVQNAMPHM